MTTMRRAATARAERVGGARGPALVARLFAPVDIAALVYFRIVLGAVLLWEVGRYFTHGWIARYYIDPPFNFTYYGFSWVQPWPGQGMYVHFVVLGLCAAAVLLGFRYRVAAVGLWAAFTYVFLLDQARYLNHFYLLSLLTFVMIFIPAHRAWSIDACRSPAITSGTAPAWALWLVRFQIGVPYMYGGVAKMNADWLAGEPLGSWLRAHQAVPVVGPMLGDHHVALLSAYGGILFDLAIVPLMLSRRTRPVAFAAAVLFHATNAMLFRIGVFPWLMVCGTAMFFDPGWPRLVLRRIGAQFNAAAHGIATVAAPSEIPVLQRRRLIAAALGCYVIMQLAVPLRHWLYPGDVNWTEEGHRFSWRMKLRDKDASVAFIAVDRRTGEQWDVDLLRYIAAWQLEAMASRPDMILQMAHHIGASESRPVAVTVVSWASLNGGPMRPLIHPDVDLCAERLTWRPARWILPVESDD